MQFIPFKGIATRFGFVDVDQNQNISLTAVGFMGDCHDFAAAIIMSYGSLINQAVDYFEVFRLNLPGKVGLIRAYLSLTST
jgi:hypothetical protein